MLPDSGQLKQVVLGVIITIAIVWTLSSSQAPDTNEMLYCIGIGVLTLVYFIYFCVKVGQRSRPVLSLRGLRFEDAKLDIDWVEWSRIKRAKYSWLFQRLYLFDQQDRKILVISWNELGSPSIARECTRAINNAIVTYSDGVSDS